MIHVYVIEHSIIWSLTIGVVTGFIRMQDWFALSLNNYEFDGNKMNK